ncbi:MULTISPECIES: NAD(P)/FAD-dependent oxidoreductase [unclassified Legionella]|uniref:FAD-dependent oxidoreductase n=1 Tax=unclassified Legionella TaxID=2622702 RepID=UPI001054DF6A|nr:MULTISPECIES: hypothetical protein [unclassified Legionella]MDI9819020.1 hypothetical protein [Legionella sp. PL877]
MGKFEGQDVDIVVVGAGPLGLLNAIGLMKKKNPKPKIIMLEKYEQYQRSHNLSMDYRQLGKFIKACGGDEKLSELYKRIKINRHIRTNEVEQTLRQYAEELGIEIRTGEEVKNVKEDVYDRFPNARLVLGADGTHSVVSREVFGEDNIQKFPFDYVMQLRFEVEGEQPVKSCQLSALSAFMQAYGVVCQEFVGKKDDDGKTPITFQVMISKEHFGQLQAIATSKNPILPFSPNQEKVEQLPSQLLDLIKGYLGLRIAHYTHKNHSLRIDEARISVNEAPATRAKVVWKQDNANRRQILLVGDAALGLSYFKGLNAGIENAAKLLPALCSGSEEELKQYESWFDRYFVPRKVKAVESYSKYRIRLPEKLFNFFNVLFGKQFLLDAKEAEHITESYVGYVNSGTEKGKREKPPFKAYPHRSKPESPLLNLQPNPFNFIYQTNKYYSNYGKPYKSTYHFLLDLGQPLRSIYHLAGSVLKFGLAVPVLVLKIASSLIYADKRQTRLQRLKNDFIDFGMRLLEGYSQCILGSTLAVGMILYPFKIAVRGIQTVVAYSQNKQSLYVENNQGIQRLVRKAEESHAEGDKETYNALRVQLHRKYRNAIKKGQSSTIDSSTEETAFKNYKPDNPDSYANYFSLFKTHMPRQANVEQAPAYISV